MSQGFVPHPTTQVVIAHQETNAIGTVGFVISLLGVLSCGLLGPIGLIFSLIGLMYRPKEMAIAGTIFGLLGSLWLFFFGFAMITAMYAAMFAVNEAGKEITRLNKESMQRHEENMRQLEADAQEIQKSLMQSVEEPKGSDDSPSNTASVEPPVTPEEKDTPSEPKKDGPINIGPPSEEATPKNLPPPNPSPLLKGSLGGGYSPPIERTPRTFKSADGKFSVEAIFLSKAGEKVKLKRESDGKEITVDFDVLSDDDQQWIKRGAYKQRSANELDK